MENITNNVYLKQSTLPALLKICTSTVRTCHDTPSSLNTLISFETGTRFAGSPSMPAPSTRLETPWYCGRVKTLRASTTWKLNV